MKFLSRMAFHPQPFDPNEVIVSHEIDVLCYTSGDASVLAGRVALDYLDFNRASQLGQPVAHVCDADSADWMNVYSSVVEPSHDFEEIRKDFGFKDPIDGILYLHQSVFHSSLRQWQRFIVDQICNMFPPSTATIMKRNQTDMDDIERASLGFKIIAGSEFLFRPNMLKNDYSAVDDDRNTLDLVVSAEVQDYVHEHWNID